MKVVGPSSGTLHYEISRESDEDLGRGGYIKLDRGRRLGIEIDRDIFTGVVEEFISDMEKSVSSEDDKVEFVIGCSPFDSVSKRIEKYWDMIEEGKIEEFEEEMLKEIETSMETKRRLAIREYPPKVPIEYRGAESVLDILYIDRLKHFPPGAEEKEKEIMDSIRKYADDKGLEWVVR
tara:strand:- start:40 stop:573 length:534 start_codon:yes stop_codon:yes gene_type:complete